MDIRTKAIGSVMLLIAVMSSIFLVMSISHLQEDLDRIVEGKKRSAAAIAENTQKQTFAHYRQRIVSLATTKKPVIDAFDRLDRDRLYQVTSKFYETIRGENPYFAIMHFHLPDGTTFLRMHRPEEYGDDLRVVRPMVEEVHRTRQQQSGYEVGRSGLFYRVIQPMFAHGAYIGALEFGIDARQLVAELRRSLGPHVALLVKKEEWSKVTFVPQKARPLCGRYVLLPGASAPLFDQEVGSADFSCSDTELDVGNRHYALLSNLTLDNHLGKAIGRVLIAIDVTAEKAAIRAFIWKAAGLIALLMLLAFLVLHFSFSALLARIFDLNRSLSQSNRELAHSKLYVDNIISAMSDALLVVDRNGRLQSCNRTAEELLGCGREELAGRLVTDLFVGGREESDELLARLQEGSLRKSERTLSARDGRRIPVLFSAAPLPTTEGFAAGIVCIATDITEQKSAARALQEAHDQLEQRVRERTAELAEANRNLTEEMVERQRVEKELRQMEKMNAIGTLAGGIAHDFNNILTAILGYAEMARERAEAGSRLHEDIDEVIQAGSRAKDLVRQILSFSRQTDTDRTPVALPPLIKETVKLLRASIPTTIEIRADVDQRCGSVLADPTQLHQVLMNLCTNAYHAMRENGGVLTVGLREVEVSPEDYSKLLELRPGRYVRLEVCDTGSGIDRENLARIFEPYFTTKGPGEGTGLGLSVVHGIVTSHNGLITVYSEPGKGTSFHVYLPLYAEAESEVREVAAELPTGSEAILVIDDEAVIVHLLCEILEGLGYRVHPAASSVMALRAFKEKPDSFDLVISDMTMPEITGAELAREMLATRPDMPIILCTGFSDAIDEKRARALGVRRLLMKPVLRAELARIVRETLDAGTGQAPS